MPSTPFSSSSVRSEHFFHISGQVTNPVILEDFVVEHAMVHSAIMFGQARYNAGVLIDLEDGFKVDPSDVQQVAETRSRLLPVIERVNMFAPQHARIQKEMILFAAPTKPFIYSPTNVNQVNRRDTLMEYNGEIIAHYDTIARAARISLNPPKVWSPNSALAYVRGIIVAVIGKTLDDDADFFDHGMDSLQATRSRIILFHALQSTANLDTRKLSGNIVYQYPTIASLAGFAAHTALECFRHRTASSLARCREMSVMVRNHSQNFPTHNPCAARPRVDVVLITGTTGLFGSNLLAQFLQCPKVKHVYALNHKKSRLGSVVERQASLLQACGLDGALARHSKLTLIDADTSRSQLGLSQELHDQLLCTATHIVHNAWLSTYDDNLSLSVFGGSFHILRNIVDFALSSPLPTPPRLLFISSTDTVRGASRALDSDDDASPVALRGSISACDAVGNTNGESKWVGEQILTAAASETPLQPILVRLGPLCGATNGRWRDGALLPMIAELSVALCALPIIDEVVHWIPVHIAAQVVVAQRNTTAPVLHLTHPRPVSSLALFRTLGTTLGLPLIPLAQWTARLEQYVYETQPLPRADTRRGDDDPALMVLSHVYRARDPTTTDDDLPTRIFDHVRPGVGGCAEVWCSSKMAAGTEMEGMRPLGDADVELWVKHWREMSIVPP